MLEPAGRPQYNFIYMVLSLNKDKYYKVPSMNSEDLN